MHTTHRTARIAAVLLAGLVAWAIAAPFAFAATASGSKKPKVRATQMHSPKYRLGGIVRKFGTDSYGMSGALANAVARGGTC